MRESALASIITIEAICTECALLGLSSMLGVTWRIPSSTTFHRVTFRACANDFS